MGWAIGYDTSLGRDIGYGVPATCDHPSCNTRINRGLSHVCGGEPFGGEDGCGLHFCGQHLVYGEKDQPVCEKCNKEELPFEPKADTEDWILWKLTDESWSEWRNENPEWVAKNTK